jgi:hypothetical protein
VRVSESEIMVVSERKRVREEREFVMKRERERERRINERRVFEY